MLLLILFAFVAGIVTILSPCILPILPIILSGSVTGGKRKPLGIVTGFVASFTFFTLFLSLLVTTLHISADLLRVIAIVTIFLFGLSLLIPQVQALIEIFFAKISSRFAPKQTQDGFLGGVLVGLSLGLLWTPCVGPILASVITLALTGSVTTTAFFITLAYAMGTAIPMLFITYTGRTLFQKIPGLLKNTIHIQQVFGVVMMLTALALMFNIDRKFQVWILQTFPNYGTGLTFFEQNESVQKNLELLNPNSDTRPSNQNSGKPMFELFDDLGKAPEIIQGGEWFNLPSGQSALSIKELRGKVVLVDFWTYSCINCIRTLPYLRDWHQKYAEKGLVIIGVHSPEFEFEKNPKNLTQAIKDFELQYPIVQDNNFDTWRAFGGNSWPRKYLIDKNGVIRNYHVGEGAYAETEAAIQALLKENGSDLQGIELNQQTYSIMSRTPETYLGYERTEGLASPERITPDKPQTFTRPEKLNLNEFSYDGEWLIAPEYAAPSPGAELRFHFESKDVYLVMRPKNSGTSGTVEVFLDDQKVDEISVDADQLYTLIKLEKPGRHILRLKFVDENLEAYAFTFG